MSGGPSLLSPSKLPLALKQTKKGGGGGGGGEGVVVSQPVV